MYGLSGIFAFTFANNCKCIRMKSFHIATDIDLLSPNLDNPLTHLVEISHRITHIGLLTCYSHVTHMLLVIILHCNTDVNITIAIMLVYLSYIIGFVGI